MKAFVFGLIIGWLLATVGLSGMARIGERVVGAATTQATEMAK